jgi:hypothetical protein
VKIRLFCLVIFMGAGALFLMPGFCSADSSDISVSAIVLTQITYLREKDKTWLVTNTDNTVSTQKVGSTIIFSLDY